MKNIKHKRILSIIFIILIVLSLKKIADDNKYDTVLKNIDLTKNPKTSIECIIDIDDMSDVKYFVQPNIITIHLRIKANSNINKLSFRSEKLDAIISQGSKKGCWYKLNEGDILSKNNKSIIPFNIELKVPRENICRYMVSSGVLKILNKKEELIKINIKVINSKYQ